MSEQLYRRVKRGAAWRYEPVDVAEYKDAGKHVVRIAHRRPSEVLAGMWRALERTVREALERKARPDDIVKAIIETVQREERR